MTTKVYILTPLKTATMDTTIAEWLNKILDLIEPVLDAYCAENEEEHSYHRGSKQISHYKAVVFEIYAYFDTDLILLKTAFLHGLTKKQATHLLSLELLEHEVFTILKTTWQIDSLDPKSHHIIDGLIANILPSITDFRGVLIHLIETLDHIDTKKKLTKWTKSFTKKPLPLPNNCKVIEYSSAHVNYDNIVSVCILAARIAEYYGFWILRNVFRNAALLHQNEAKLKTVVNFCINISNNRTLQRRYLKLHSMFLGLCFDIGSRLCGKQTLDKMLSERGINCYWEWHHAASVYYRNAELKFEKLHKKSTDNLPLTGSLVIVCCNQQECYEVLGRLHTTFKYIPKMHQDFIGIRRDEGRFKDSYNAIHTTIFDPQNPSSGRVTIKIISNVQHNNSRLSTYPTHYNLLGNLPKISRKNDQILVFTPTGKRTVLNSNANLSYYLDQHINQTRHSSLNIIEEVVVYRYEKDVNNTYNAIRKIYQGESITKLFKLKNYDIISIERYYKDVGSTIKVFTPEGLKKTLRPGACVLDFALKLHTGILICLPGPETKIKINEEVTHNIFHVLNNNDVVYIKTLEKPGILPKYWERHVSEKTKNAILNAYKKNFKKEFNSFGRIFFQELLENVGITIDDQSESLDIVIGSVFEEIAKNPSNAHFRKNDTDWWLRQLGKFYLYKHGHRISRTTKINNDTITILQKSIRKVTSRFNILFSTRSNHINERNNFHYILCPVCKPNITDQLFGAIDSAEKDKPKLILHGKGSSCKKQNLIKVKFRILPYKANYILVKARNRTDVILKTIELFNSKQRSIEEVIVQVHSKTNIVFRVLLSNISQESINDLTAELIKLDHIVEVSGPEKPPNISIESNMTPRRHFGKKFADRSSPFVQNTHISFDDEFYGMEEELQILRSSYQRMTSLKNEGLIVKLLGPKRTGKTSIAMKLHRELIRLNSPKNNNIFIFYHSITSPTTNNSNFDSISNQIFINLYREFYVYIKNTQNQEYLNDIQKIKNQSTCAIEQLDKLLFFIKTYLRTYRYCNFIFTIDEFQFWALNAKSANDRTHLLTILRSLKEIPQCLTILISAEAILKYKIGPSFNAALEKMIYKSIPVISISKDAARQLLKTEQKDVGYLPQLEESLLNKIYNDTGGNACLLNLIGDSLWEKSVHRDHVIGLMIYTKKNYESSFHEIALSQSTAFRRDDLKDKNPDLAYIKHYIVWLLTNTNLSEASCSQIHDMLMSEASPDFKYTTLKRLSKPSNISSQSVNDCLFYLEDSGFFKKLSQIEYEFIQSLSKVNSSALPLQHEHHNRGASS